MRFTPTNHRNSCPICQDVSGDCRTTQDNLILCHSFIDVDSDVAGYKWTKASSNGVWGVHILDDGKEFDREQYERYLAQKEAQERDKKQFLADNALDADGRDRAIRKLASKVGLKDHHREDLRNRGLSDAKIEGGLYFSIDPWVRFNLNLPENLPGIRYKGDCKAMPSASFATRDSGYACVIFDKQGRAIGWQLRVEGAKGNKYKWAKSSFSSHLPNGELPVTATKPNKNSDRTGRNSDFKSELTQPSAFRTLYSSEGILKPQIAHHLHDIAICGAAGGHFSGSPEQLTEIIFDYDEIAIAPDGGDVLNPQVMQRWQKQINFFKRFDKPIKIVWWGQVQKSDGDIDEIDSATFSNAEYLSPDEFIELAKEHCKVVRIDRWKQQQEAAKNQTWKQLTSLTAKPWLEVNTSELESIGLENKLERGHIYLLKSAKATGKTNAVKPLVNSFTNIYSWFNRIALGREECHKLGLDYKDDLKSYQGYLKAGFCANSAYQFNPVNLKNNGLLLGDESDQLFSYLFESICNKNGIRPAILKAFEAHLKAAVAGNGMALFMSADNSDIEYQFLKQIAPPGCEVRVIINHYQPLKGKVNFDISNTPDGSVDELVTNLKNGVPCFVIDDIKNGVKGCKSIAEYIRNLLPDVAGSIVEINSDTSGSEEIQNYLKNINSASKNTLLLICSPSVISGISIENGHFQQGYGFYNGVLTTKEASQSLVRVRGLENLTVWAAKKGFTWAGDRSLTPEGIRDYYQRNYDSNAKYLSSFDVDYDPLTDEWSSPWFELYCKYAAYRNLSMSDLRLRLKEKLEEEGYTIAEVAPEPQKDTELKLKESWSNINLEQAIAVELANILSDEELEKLSNSKEAITPEQQLDIEKTILLKRYGQPLIDTVTHQDKYTGETLTGYAALYLKDDGGRWYRQLKQLYYLIDNYDEAVRSDRAQESQQEFHGSRFAGDISWNARKRKCRKHLGIDRLFDTEWRQPQEYKQLADRGKKYHRSIKDTVGLSVKKLTPAQVYTELIRQLGLKTESKQIKQLTPDGKKTVRLRRIIPESWELAELFVAHREELRLQRATNKSVLYKPKEAVTPPPVFISKEKGGVLPSKSYIDTGFQTSKIVSKVPFQNEESMIQDSTIKPQDLINQSTTECPLDSNENGTEDFDTSEAIADLADMLAQIEDAESLAELQLVPEFTRERLNRACRLLPPKQQRLIRQWAVENQQRKTA